MMRILCGRCGMAMAPEEYRNPCPGCGEDAVATLLAMKGAAARELAQKHYEVETGLVQVFHMKSSVEIESAPLDPIKLLEVNENSTPTGVMPLYFGPIPTRSGISFPTIILEVTPDEFKRIETHELKLPDGWLHSELIPRQIAVENECADVECTVVECATVERTADEWAKVFAHQAQADFNTWAILQGDVNAGECQSLLFLRMACEKLCKAHLIRAGTAYDSLQPRLACMARPLCTVVREYLLRLRYERKDVAKILGHVRRLAGEIEVVNPATTRAGQRPDKCVYPSDDSHEIVKLSQMLVVPAGRIFVKVLSEAIDAMVSEL